MYSFLYVAIFVQIVAVLVSGQTVLEDAAGIPQCQDSINKYSCESSYSKDLINIALDCGPDYSQSTDTSVAQCTEGEDGELCFSVLSSGDVNYTNLAECASATSSATCTALCSGFLTHLVDVGGCCVETVFNEQFSTAVFGFDIQVSLDACSVSAPPACDLPFEVDPVNMDGSCNFSEYWGKVVEYICTPEVGQPYVDNIIETNVDCTPIARHVANYCGVGPGDRFCLDLIQGSFPTVDPTQAAIAHPTLGSAIDKCETFIADTSGTCPDDCKTELQAAVDEFGCCINLFDDEINEILVPQFDEAVLMACGIEPPKPCESVLKVGAGTAVRAIAVWMYLCLVLLLL